MGVYSDVLAFGSIGFWCILGASAVFTLVPLLHILWSWSGDSWGENQKKADHRGLVSFSIFIAVGTLALLHCFGDTRVLGWLYEAPDRSDPAGWHVLLTPFGPVFWLLLIAETVVAFMMIRNRSGIGATISLVITLLLVQCVTGVPVIPWIFHNKSLAMLALGGHIGIGSGWSFLYKWDKLCRDHKSRYDVVRGSWLKSKGLNEQSDFTLEDKSDWENYFANHNSDEDGAIESRPQYRAHKSELLGWAMLWPVSVFETFLFDWLNDAFLHIWKQLGGVLNWIMERRWKGTEGHMLTDEEREILKKEKEKKHHHGG
jgi:hypothetical protein